MKRRAEQRENETRAEGPKPREISEQEREQNRSAFEEAMHDIEGDPESAERTENDDLDEGETARLGGDRTDLV